MLFFVYSAVDELGMVSLADRTDIFHRSYREWNCEATALTHRARKKLALLGSFQGRPAGIDSFEGGHSMTTYSAGAGLLMPTTECLDEQPSPQWTSAMKVNI